MLSPQEFLNQYLGWGKDIDGAAGIQCVDLAKEHYRLVGVPNYRDPIGGDGYADNIWYYRERWAAWYDFIPAGSFKDGDMVIFPHKARGGWTHPYSHVCFWYGGKEFGTNQGGSPKATLINTDWSDALGALRFKGWNGEVLPYGYMELTRSGIRAKIARAPASKGYGLHVLSADGNTALKDITAFDSEKLVKFAVMNAGYFQMASGQADPVGTHYGIEQDADAGNTYTQAPKQSGILAFFENRDGVCDVCNGDQYFGTPEEVHFAITPYAVRIHKGQKTFFRSVNYGDKDDTLNTQSAAAKFDNGDWALAVFPDKIYPRDVVTFFDNFAGVQELILMDSGGSSQLLAWNNDSMQMEKKEYTERKLPNVLVLGKLAEGTPKEEEIHPQPQPVIVPIEPEPDQEAPAPAPAPEEPEPLPEVPEIIIDDREEEKMDKEVTIREQIAKLIDVKSLMTFALIGTLCYLQIEGKQLDQQFMTIVTAVVTFYFSYQVKKSGDQK
ncbi:MAG: hypothetical protein II016_02390 [Erysipelotrichaceae bacterium]|nr:hypothetical protein [Erysipelotrichaceae bacterium]